MEPLVPARHQSRRLPASTCAEIEMAAERIGDREVVAWLQRHHAAATTDGPLLRPYDKDAIAWFRAGLLHAPAGQPALILSDGRAFEARDGLLGEQLEDVSFEALKLRHGLGRSKAQHILFWAGMVVVLALIAFRLAVLG